MTSLVRILSCMAVASLVVFSTPCVNADIMGFNGIYAVGNWTPGIPPTAAIDLTFAPNSISLTSADDLNNIAGPTVDTTFSIMITVDGSISFDWTYLTSNSNPQEDPFGYFVNGNQFELKNAGSLGEGPVSSGAIPVFMGDNFGFYQRTTDQRFGAATTTISSFRGPGELAAVPEPATASLLGIAVLTGAFWQFFKRRRLATTA